MKRALILMACLPFISGFGCSTFQFKSGDPFNANCSEKCFQPCNEESLTITADPDTAILSKKYEHSLREACDVRRDLCVQCINRAKENGTIK